MSLLVARAVYQAKKAYLVKPKETKQLILRTLKS
jgi:hypothetical protein